MGPSFSIFSCVLTSVGVPFCQRTFLKKIGMLRKYHLRFSPFAHLINKNVYCYAKRNAYFSASLTCMSSSMHYCQLVFVVFEHVSFFNVTRVSEKACFKREKSYKVFMISLTKKKK